MVHGGHATFDDQLNKMAAIYAGAVFTIVAADGDGLVGIKGLRNISERREPPQQVFHIGEDLLVMPTQLGSRDALYDNDLQYHKRAWTYQEFVMSPRKIIFVNQRPYWVCACCEWHEDDARETNHKLSLAFENLGGKTVHEPARKGPREVTLEGYTGLASLNHMINQYNRRSLTYGGDALSAISGLLAVLSRKFAGGFLHGLPVKFFDVALSWQHHHDPMSDGSEELKRRIISEYPDRAMKRITGFPSWSWTTWEGPIEFGLQEAGEASDQENQYREVHETRPITSWYTSSELDGTARRRISSTWYIDRENSKDRSLPLPEGWSRWIRLGPGYLYPFGGIEIPAVDDQPPGPVEPENHWTSTAYRHVDMQDARYRSWSYAYPMPKIDTSTPFEIPEQSPYLFCKTWKTSLWVHRHSSIIKVHPSIDNTHMVPMTSELDFHSLDVNMSPLDRPIALHDDQIVGLLHLHNAE